MNLYGIAASFDRADSILSAALALRAAGYDRLEAYSPFPMEDLSQAVGVTRDYMALITLVGGLVGGIGGYFMQWYANVVDYPINVGGRPFHSWPSFIPVTFELTVLGASIFAAIGMLALNRLPKLYHPIFQLGDFERASAGTSANAFVLCVLAQDPRFEVGAVCDIFKKLGAKSVAEIPAGFPEEET